MKDPIEPAEEFGEFIEDEEFGESDRNWKVHLGVAVLVVGLLVAMKPSRASTYVGRNSHPEHR